MRSSRSAIDFYSERAIIASRTNDWICFSFFHTTPAPPARTGGIAREIITARPAAHQHSLMAPHYAKRLAKGAWNFLPPDRRIRKDQPRLPSVAFFALRQGSQSTAIIVLRCRGSPLTRLVAI